MKKYILSLAIASCVTSAMAANITFHPNEKVITIDGGIDYGDEKKFLQLALPLEPGAFVTFRNNPGGNLYAGIEIGKIIRLKGLNTFAPNECYSSCALAWAAGIKRVMNSTSKVGFHAAYVVKSDGTTEATAQGNAVVGAYLNSLGFSETAIRFATYRDANGVELLDKELADKLGIIVTVNDAQSTGNVTRLSQAQRDALKMVKEGKWGCDTDFTTYQKHIRCWDLPAYKQENLMKICWVGPSNAGPGAIGYTHADRRKFVIIKDDPDRLSCTTTNGKSGRGIYARLES